MPIAEEFPRFPPGHDDVVWRLPVEAFQQFDRSSFLSFETVRVHRVQQIDRHALHHFIEHTHAAVEVSLQLAGDGAVVERLRKFSPGNLALRNQDQAAHARARRVSRHRS